MIAKVYIAAPFSRGPDAEELATKIEADTTGRFVVVSRWHRSWPVNFRTAHTCNMLDLAEADVLIALTDPELGRETYVEIGMCLANDKPVIWLPLEDRKERECLSLMMSDRVIRSATSGENYTKRRNDAIAALRLVTEAMA